MKSSSFNEIKITLTDMAEGPTMIYDSDCHNDLALNTRVGNRI